MSNLFPKNKEEFEEKQKRVRDFVQISIEHIIVQYPHGSIQIECPKCRWRMLHDIENPMYVDKIVNWIMDRANQSEVFRLTLLAEMADKVNET